MAFTPSVYERKFYLNGFPKAGIHLLDLMIRPLALPMPKDSRWMTPWAGIYRGHSWTTDFTPVSIVTFRIGRVQDGHFLKGHLGHFPDLATFMKALGMIHIFIIRDFRDVAVSSVYHIKNPDKHDFPHPAKEMLQDKDFDQVLDAVLLGVKVPDGFYCPGIMERWKGYAPWLDEPWVLTIKFEDAIREPFDTSVKIIQYMLDRIGGIFNKTGEMSDEARDLIAHNMVDTSRKTDLSPTFRKGEIGNWKDHFKQSHVDAFKEADFNNWLERLGYVDDHDW